MRDKQHNKEDGIMTRVERTLLQCRALISKGMAEGAYNGMVGRRMPEKVIKNIDDILKGNPEKKKEPRIDARRERWNEYALAGEKKPAKLAAKVGYTMAELTRAVERHGLK